MLFPKNTIRLTFGSMFCAPLMDAQNIKKQNSGEKMSAAKSDHELSFVR